MARDQFINRSPRGHRCQPLANQAATGREVIRGGKGGKGDAAIFGISQTASPVTFYGLDFCRGFFRWHNEEHCHSGIGLLTPAVVHTGQATAVLEARASVLAAAHARHPERFVQGVPRPLTPAAAVWINPPENRPTVRTLELPRDTQFVPQVSQSH